MPPSTFRAEVDALEICELVAFKHWLEINAKRPKHWWPGGFETLLENQKVLFPRHCVALDFNIC